MLTVGALLLSLTAGATKPVTIPVHVSIEVHSTVPASHQPDGTIEAVSVGGKSDEAPAATVSVPFQVGPGATLQLLPGRLWELQARAKGWWARPVPLYLTGQRGDATLELWPECDFHGTLDVGQGSALPASVKLWFRPLVGRVSGPVQHEGGHPTQWWQEFEEATCVMNGSVFHCAVPTTIMDIKVRACGFVSLYWWAKSLPEHGSVDVGRVRLKPGASLVGFVTTVTGPAKPAECQVTLAPEVGGSEPPPEAMERNRLRGLRTTIDAGGFYAFEGIEPGSYTLEARQEGFAPARHAHVWIQERTELQGETLVLERPLDLSVEVCPARDAYGAAWTLEVLAVDEQHRYSPVTRSQVPESGVFQSKGLARGQYVLLLEDSAGSHFLEEEIRLESPSAPVVLEAKLIPVEGRITLGRRPLAAKIWFGGQHGASSIEMVTDNDGEYSGFLPREGKWKVDVTSEHPLVHSAPVVNVKYSSDLGWASVDIALPDTRLRGTVVGEDAQAVAGATVAVIGGGGERFATTSGEDGAFDVAGLAAGIVTVQASDTVADGPRTSDPLTVVLASGSTSAPIQLVLKRSREVTIRVLNDQGQGVFGALVELFRDPAEGLITESPWGSTDFTGEVRLRVPRGIPRWTMEVGAQGYCFGVFDFESDSDAPVSVVLTRYGGTLRLRVAGPLLAPDNYSSDIALVWLDGRMLNTSTLQAWAAANGWPIGPRLQELTLPQMPQGQYVLCYVSALSVLSPGGLDRSRSPHCAGGFLPPLGELVLTPK